MFIIFYLDYSSPNCGETALGKGDMLLQTILHLFMSGGDDIQYTNYPFFHTYCREMLDGGE